MDAPVSDWRAIALSEEVTGAAPLGTYLGPAPVVLFRDADGVVRALEDRCIHRRVPMSMGRITPDGMIQCGYHGWIYDGRDGQCARIPNLRDDEPISPRYRLETFRAVDVDGFVFVAPAACTVPPPAPRPGIAGLRHGGAARVATAHADYLAALLDGPDLLIDLPGVRITDYQLGDVRVVGTTLVSERSCVWPGLKIRTSFLWEQPLRLRTELDLSTSIATLTLIDRDEATLLTAILAIAPGMRGTTSIRWRASDAVSARGAGLAWRRVAVGAKPPLKVRTTIDGTRLASLLVGPSRAIADAIAPALSVAA